MIVQKRLFAFTVALILCGVANLQAAQVAFVPTATLREEYTDNLFLSSQNEEQEYITSAGLDLAGEMIWRTAGINLNYRPTYNRFNENDDLNYWRHEAGLYLWKEFGRNTKFEVRDSYLRTNNPTDESQAVNQDDQAQGPSIEADRNRRGRNEYYANIAGASITHQFGANDHISAGYQYSILRDVDTLPGTTVNDNDIATPSIELVNYFSPNWGIEINSAYAITDYKEKNDRNEFDGNVRLLYRFDRTLSGFVDYRHTILTYDQDTDEDYNVYRPSIGVRYVFEKNARIQVGAGYYIQDFETSSDTNGYTISSDIFKKWNYRTGYYGISGGSGYVIDDNGSQDNGLDIYYQARLEAGRNFTSKLTGLIFGSYRYDKYPDEDPERVEKTISAGMRMDWQALQWMTVGLSYTISDLNSDIGSNEYTENRVMLTIGIHPSSPYRLN